MSILAAIRRWLRKDERRQRIDLTHATEARRIRAIWIEADLHRRAANGDLPIEPGPKQ